MSKIKRVFYTEIDEKDCSLERSGEFYYHFNMMNVNDFFQKDYEDYETKQLELRNSIIGNNINDMPSHPNMSFTIFGISSIKDKTILAVEL